MVVIDKVKKDRIICTIALQYPHNNIPPDDVIKHHLYKGSNTFTRAINHRAENWKDFRSKWTKGGMVFAVDVEYVKNDS